MVGVLVGLRIRLLLARCDTPGRVVGWGVACAVSGALGCAGALVTGALGAVPDATLPARAAATLLLGAWTFAPLLAMFVGAADQSLDVHRYAVLPLRGRQLVPGLLVAGFVSPLAWATSLVVVGFVAGHVRTAGGAGLAVVAAVCLLVAAVAGNRLVAALLAVLVRHGRRRAAVAGVVAASIVAAAVWLSGEAAEVGDVLLRHNPAGHVADSLRAIRSGSLADAAVSLAWPSAYVVAVGVVWARTLERALIAARGHGARSRSLVRPIVGLLPGRDRRLAGRFAVSLVLSWRDPVRGVNWCAALVLGVGLGLYLVGGLGAGPSILVVLPAVVAGMVAAGPNLNSFGLDGTAVWPELISGSMRGPAIARLAVTVATGVPIVVVASVPTWLLGGEPLASAAGLALGVATLAAFGGTGLVLGSRFPLRPPPSPFTPSPDLATGNAGPSAAASLATVAAMAPGGWLLVLGARSGSAGLVAVGAAVAVAVGVGVAALGVASASRHLEWHQPEVFARLLGDRSSNQPTGAAVDDAATTASAPTPGARRE